MDNGYVGYPEQEQQLCHPTDDDGQDSHKLAFSDRNQEHGLRVYLPIKPPEKVKTFINEGKVLPPTPVPASPGDFVDIKKGKLLVQPQGSQVSEKCDVNDLGVEFRPEGRNFIRHIEQELLQRQFLEDLLTANTKIWSDDYKQPKTQITEGRVEYCTDDTLPKLSHLSGKVAPETGVITTKLLCSEEGHYWEGKNGQFVNEGLLGQGSYGKVSLCCDCNTLQKFVQKQITGNYNPAEVDALASLNHPNIMKLYGLIKRLQGMEILIEYAGLSLNQFLQDSRKAAMITDETIWNLAGQGLAALEYLDIHQIRHHDIKPDNVCLLEEDNKLTLKLADFGSAQRPGQPITFAGWTPEYLAPEACQAFFVIKMPHVTLHIDPAAFPLQITGKVDVWALALTIQYMYQRVHLLLSLMTNGEGSYRNVQNPDALRVQMMYKVAQDPHMMQHFITDECSPEMRELLKKMLEGSQRQRPTAQEARQIMKNLENRVQYPGFTLCRPQKPVTDLIKGPARRPRQESVMQLDSGVSSSSAHSESENRIPIIEPASPMEVEPPSPAGDQARTELRKKLRDKINPPTHGKGRQTKGKAMKSINPQNTVVEPIYIVPSVKLECENRFDGGNMPNFAFLE